MNTLFTIFLAVIIVSLIGIILLIYVQTEPVKTVVFFTFALFTLCVNAMFVTVPPESYINIRIAAYICGGVAILAIILQLLFPKTETFTKILLVLSLIAAIIGVFFT